MCQNIAVVRFPSGKGIGGHVAQTGEPVHVADAYQDSIHSELVSHSGRLEGTFSEIKMGRGQKHFGTKIGNNFAKSPLFFPLCTLYRHAQI